MRVSTRRTISSMTASEIAGAGGGKGFDSLPADAKAQCKADAREFVGEGRPFKTTAEWNKHYADLYWSQE